MKRVKNILKIIFIITLWSLLLFILSVGGGDTKGLFYIDKK